MEFHKLIEAEKPASGPKTQKRNCFRVLSSWLVSLISSLESRLLRAVSTGNLEMLKEILDVGANPNEYEGQLSPLWVAVCNCRLDIVECLLKYGACADGGVSTCPITGIKGSPLVIAVIRRREDMIRGLLAAGADINNNATQSRGRTALAVAAARGGSVEIVKILMNAGACVSKPDVWGRTPLSRATSNEDVDLIDILLPYLVNRPDILKDALARTAMLPSLKIAKQLMMSESRYYRNIIYNITGNTSTAAVQGSATPATPLL